MQNKNDIKGDIKMVENRKKLLEQIGITKSVKKLAGYEWNEISENKILSEEFIREFQTHLNWSAICQYQQLSEDFIREFKENVYWYSIFKNQKLSKKFIYEFQPKVNWFAISCSQHITDDFLIEFQDNIYWESYFVQHKASFNIIKKFILKSYFLKLDDLDVSHLTIVLKKKIKKMFKLKYMFTK